MIEELLNEDSVTEIVLQGTEEVLYERSGKLYSACDPWSSINYESLSQEILTALPKAPSYEYPLASGIWRNFRVQVASPPTLDHTLIQLRRLSGTHLCQGFKGIDWGAGPEVELLLKQKMLEDKCNFLIVGPTGCGKTTLLKNILVSYCQEDRVICLEDTPELPKVNALSCNLKTFLSSSTDLNDVTLKDLIKASLRLRPDRLMMGEMRGEEAADFLLMLSTGHKGSGATLHAHDPHDALRRLEMLVQMGSPWPVQTIRRLLHTSLDVIITMERTSLGERRIKMISEIKGCEEDGLLVEGLYIRPDSDLESYF